MTTPLIECVPNFSDARRPEVIAAISQAISNAGDVHILDQHSDNDHNRTVITFVGSPAGVEEAAYQAIAKAAELIDLDQHSGEHPRMGATDVVPFIPIAGASMADCVAIAKRLGERVAKTLDIPVYLYEEAAASPARRNLEYHRKGQYETLKDVIASDPNRAPDFGPKKVGPAGATVIGAREFLIAYNVYLTSDDVNIAKKIAKAVRHSSGGLRFVKGLGMLVEGRAQVSMNLTNFRKTPIARVVEFIRREARRYGVEIHHSELVGLIPQNALVDAAVWYTQMDQFEPGQVLENKLYAAQQKTADVPELGSGLNLDDLASESPTPGGGSAAAHAGAMGAALVAMVARLSIGKKKYADVEGEMQAVLSEAESLRADLSAAVAEDAAAFDGIMAAFKMPKASEDEKDARSAAIQKATIHAAEVPLATARKAVRVFELAVDVASSGNTNAISDGASGAALAQAALTGAGYNVRINILGLKDQDVIANLLSEIGELDERARELKTVLEDLLTQRGGLSLG
ncbi:MAG: glutamate formimidoyltransferase [Chloroflexota bacterium]